MDVKKQCLSVYKQAFDECIPFEERLFNEAFECCRYITVDGKAASILFALPCFIEKKEKRIDAVYIFAAATEKSHRKKGLMARLLEEAKKEFDGVIFLRPASGELVEYYKKFGFREICGIASKEVYPKVKPTEVLESISQGFADESGEEFTLMYYSETEELQSLGFIYSME